MGKYVKWKFHIKSQHPPKSVYLGSSHCPLYLTSTCLILSHYLVLCSSLHLYKCTLHLYVFCMYMFFRSRGFVLLTAVPRCLAQCQHMWNTDWLEDRNKVDILWGQSPSLELGYPQRALDWEMWRFCRIWVLLPLTTNTFWKGLPLDSHSKTECVTGKLYLFTNDWKKFHRGQIRSLSLFRDEGPNRGLTIKENLIIFQDSYEYIMLLCNITYFITQKWLTVIACFS